MPISIKRFIFWFLIILFVFHTFLVDTVGTTNDLAKDLMNFEAQNGKLLFQKYNCTACHQIYGLGGFMGPDLTNVMSKFGLGELYVRAFLKGGTERMPNFHMSDDEINCLVAYLKYVDGTGVSPVRKFKINIDGTVIQK